MSRESQLEMKSKDSWSFEVLLKYFIIFTF